MRNISLIYRHVSASEKKRKKENVSIRYLHSNVIVRNNKNGRCNRKFILRCLERIDSEFLGKIFN